ncbi:MAG: hypothetical protein ACRDRW_02985 [Pseudonocardiaceae bacterium]
MPHTHDHHTVIDRPDHDGHPSWCSPQHCLINEHGVQVHQQELVHWEADSCPHARAEAARGNAE